MNFSQRLGLLILIAISVLYVYSTYFNKEFKMPEFNNQQKEQGEYNPFVKPEESEKTEKKSEQKNIKIFVLDKTGNLRSVNRTCDTAVEDSCFAYAIKELVKAPSKWEKSKGFTSEIPQGTKILSIRESENSIMIDLSSAFETGGGAESTYTRIHQVIKTANANTSIPTYLYINGRQANVIGGEGIMIKQPLSERSFDE
jgi:spore germination protein GerM